MKAITRPARPNVRIVTIVKRIPRGMCTGGVLIVRRQVKA